MSNGKEDEDSLELQRLLAENLAYTRSIAAMAAKSLARSVIDSYEKARVFSMLDGEKTHYDISDDLGISRETVRNWVRAFVGNGLVTVPNKYSKSNKALYTLDELGISLDVLRTTSKKNKTTNSKTSSQEDDTKAEGQALSSVESDNSSP